VVAYHQEPGNKLVGQDRQRQAVIETGEHFYSVKRFMRPPVDEVNEGIQRSELRASEKAGSNVEGESAPVLSNSSRLEEYAAEVLRKLRRRRR